jgi:SAM-dependent methyltransferase
MSYVERGRPAGRAIQVLDAGCGRGVGVIGAAVTQPDVDFLGVDLCREALADARAEAARRGLANVRFAELDLMTLEGLEVPSGGFDVILSSGVLHHLVDPREGLRRLSDVLAPHGVLSLMVYGRRGRESLYRVVRAIDALAPRELPLEQRLRLGRQLVESASSEAFTCGPWSDQRTISDVEFVDRYLNVHETSYDVPALFELIESAGLSFVRWAEPADWNIDALLPAGPLREHVKSLPSTRQFALVDELTFRPSLECVLARSGYRARSPLGELDRTAALAWSPEALLRVERRNLRGSQRTESLSIQVRRRAPVALTSGPVARAALAIEAQQEPFLFGDLLNVLAESGLGASQARDAVLELLAIEALYRPHVADL